MSSKLCGQAAYNSAKMNQPQQNVIPLTRTPAWQRALQQAISDPVTLLSALELGEEWLAPAQAAAKHFPLRVPRSFVARMERSNPHDPLLRQILPLGEELVTTPGFVADPTGDLASHNAPGVLHKYHGRALLITTGACGVHCRYCFRRHYPYQAAHAAAANWQPALDYLAKDDSINEVILSGGDPLSLSDEKLAHLAAELATIPHLNTLRIHTRQPIVLPERVDDALLSWLQKTRLNTVLVLHANHANEIDNAVRAACTKLRSANITLLNQSVLLRGVNDSATALTQLSQALFGAGVLPYYLHLLDRTQGAAHFEVTETTAKALIQQISAQLPGYLVPRLVREIAGEPNKTAIY